MICIHLLDRYRYGGAERVALTYQQTLSECLGIKSAVYAIQDFERGPEKDVYLFRNHLRMLFRLFKLIFDSKSIFFCHTTKTLFICCLLKVLFHKKVKIIYIRHFQYTQLTRIIMSILGLFVNKAVLITPAERSVAERLFSGKLHYINNYINCDVVNENELNEKIQIWSENRKIIAFAGGMKKGKNAVHLLELSTVLGTRDYCYLFIGDGPEREAVKTFHETNKEYLQNAVFYCGFQNDVISILKTANYFFFPSWNSYEMMPMVLLEAMTAKCICFAYNMKINSYILPGENLFDFKDFNSIAESIRNKRLKLIQNPFDLHYGKSKLSDLLKFN